MKIKVEPKFRMQTVTNRLIQKFWHLLPAELSVIGDSAHSHMREHIDAHITRPGSTGNLSSSITKDFTAGGGRLFVGIGNIDILNAQAPYWYVLNYGKMITGEPFIPGGGKWVPRGEFQPGTPEPNPSDFRGGRWVPGAGGHTFQAKRPIEPINYIEATKMMVDAQLSNLIQKLRTL